MSKIIKFMQEETEEHSCPTCDLISEHIAYIAESESPEELFDALSELVTDAKDLGVREYIIHDIGSKFHVLEHLDGTCDCCEDCEGNCEDFCEKCCDDTEFDL